MTPPTNNASVERQIRIGRQCVWAVAVLFTILFASQMIAYFSAAATLRNGSFDLKKAGQYTLFIETLQSSPAHPFKIVAKSDGGILDAAGFWGEQTLDINGKDYRGVGYFSIPSAGSYSISTNGQPYLGAAIFMPPLPSFFFVTTCGFIFSTVALIITEVKLMRRARILSRAKSSMAGAETT
jgi:hypothetical protein